MKSILHLLRYLRDHVYLGLKFYLDISMSPITDCCQEMESLWIILFTLSLTHLGMTILIQAGVQDAL
jgi:hypothetical protein